METTKFIRRYEYYADEVLTSRELTKERTLFGYTESITKNYLEQFNLSHKKEIEVSIKTFVAAKISNIFILLIALISGFMLINPLILGYMNPGIFIGVFAAMLNLVAVLGGPFQTAASLFSSSSEYMEELTEFMGLSTKEGAINLPDSYPIEFESLEFKNVTFKYPNSEKLIFHKLSFKLLAGKRYFFVGANGAGKTTITKLLTGLYDEYEGEILINGKELRDYDYSKIKALFSVIHQDFSKYQISLKDNISLGSLPENIDINKVESAAINIGLGETIKKLEKGINTNLGKLDEDSIDIPEGQWQKISLARSVLSKSPVKILDEPTSALDPIAESELYENFDEIMKGKTSIFISHRLGSTKLADEILLVDNGKIAERGTHENLMKKEGVYSKMFESQRKWYE